MIPDITSLDLSSFNGLDPHEKDLCTLEASVPTGFEDVAADECREKLEASPVMIRGRIFFDLPSSKVPQALELRSIEHLNVVILTEPKLTLSGEREDCFKKLYKLAEKPDWQKGLNVWHSTFEEGKFEDFFENEQLLENEICKPHPETDLHQIKSSSVAHNLPQNIVNSIKELNNESIAEGCSPPQSEENSNDASLKDESQPQFRNVQRKGGGPKFRVTCHRTGSNHAFGSPEAARQFGGGINEKFGWPVDLSNHKLEVILNIHEDFVYSCVGLTREPLFRRNITHFGLTNLKASICYNLLRLAQLQVGDVVLDHMCGGATIPIEGSLGFPHCFYLGGDSFSAAVERSRRNISTLVAKKKSLSIDVAHWDATRLPLRDRCIDVVVSDLPFGKRMGSKFDNRVLYLRSLIEVARVTRVETGRAVLLTQDRSNMIKSLQKVSSLWKNAASRTINIGGLTAGVFLLRRTSLLSDSALTDLLNRRSRKRKLPPPDLDKGD